MPRYIFDDFYDGNDIEIIKAKKEESERMLKGIFIFYPEDDELNEKLD